MAEKQDEKLKEEKPKADSQKAAEKKEIKPEIKKEEQKPDIKKEEKAEKKEAKEHKADAEKLAAEQEKILQMSEISLWIDDYDDIFSDFDPRPYSQRSLSDDFLAEAKKASRDKPEDKLELRFLVPEAKRDSKNEALIRKRLREHFSKHARDLDKELIKTRNRAIIMIVIGIFFMFVAAFIDVFVKSVFFSKIFFVIFEPAGWFLTWFGFDKFFYASEQTKSEYNFYRKMSKAEVIFKSY